MIPSNMLRDFEEEIRSAIKTANFILKDENGEYRLPEVFEHTLPPISKSSQPRVPWVLVTLYSGDQASASDPRQVTLHIICKTFDDNENMMGYIDSMNLIELICQHLYSKTIIAGQYNVIYPYQFAVLDDVRYPYFSAGLAIRVQLPGTTPQNPIGGYSYV